MLHVVVRCALAAVLVAAAAAKVARPGESRDALRSLVSWLPLPVLVAVELALAAGVAAGLDAAALAASVFLLAAAAVLGRALADGRDGAPCGCFGARSKVSRLAVLRNLALAAAFGALPFIPRTDPSADAWLPPAWRSRSSPSSCSPSWCSRSRARSGCSASRSARSRRSRSPRRARAVGADSGLAGYLDPRVDPTVLGLAVFTSDGCRLCQQLKPAIRALGRDPHVSLVELDEVRDAEPWQRLEFPGSPFAIALDAGGRVLAKGTFNSLPQLESVLATAERRAGSTPVSEKLTDELALRTSRRGLLSRVGTVLLGATAGSAVKAVVDPGEADGYHFCGHIYTTDSCPHPTGLPRIDVKGYPLRAKDGKRIDNVGRVVNTKGQPIDERRRAAARRRRRAARRPRRARGSATRSPSATTSRRAPTAPGTAAAAAACASSSTAARPAGAASTATRR